jgi:glycine dehydrogenase
MPVSLAHPDVFSTRHIGPDDDEVAHMLATLGLGSLEDLVASAVPAAIRLGRKLDLPPARSEHQLLDDLEKIAGQNQIWRSYLGMGYSDTITPPVILRNILMNPGWYGV